MAERTSTTWSTAENGSIQASRNLSDVSRSLLETRSIESKHRIASCNTCFDLDADCIPPEKNYFHAEAQGLGGQKRIYTFWKSLQLSAAGGCLACAVLLRCLSVSCARLEYESNHKWQRLDSLEIIGLQFHPGLGLQVFVESGELGEDSVITKEGYVSFEFYTDTSQCIFHPAGQD